MVTINEFKGSDIPAGQMNLIFRSRILWRDMATWTRAYLVSLYAGFGNQEAVKQRLYRLPIEFSNTIKVIFGDQSAEKYMNLLSNSITILESLVTAQRNGDANAIKEYTIRLYDNANQMAAFLSQINPFWQENQWKNLLYAYVEMTIEESTAFLTKDYTRDIEVFDRILSHTSVMGDYLSQGILNYLTYSGR